MWTAMKSWQATQFVFEVKNEKKTTVRANSFCDPKEEVSYLKGSFKKRADKIFHLDSHEMQRKICILIKIGFFR
jgi:argonaute-like protein implicated in RNA metabolism and viral defense